LSDNWYKLDNVAKVFLANQDNRNTQSLRVSFTLDKEIEPVLLQQALETTLTSLPQIHVRLRRGFFWHYLEASKEKPAVTPETGRPCPLLYGGRHGTYLHYSVTYYKSRINFEIFHAIADGTGAFHFIEVLTLNYLKLVYPGEFDEISLSGNSSSADRSQNSFEHFYDNSNGPIPKTILNKKPNAFHILSRKLPYDQLQFFEIHLEADKIRKASKETGAGLSAYLVAKLMLAIRDDIPFSQRQKPVTISMPVNLRNYYPSETVRNFFNNVDISHVFTDDESLSDLAKKFDESLKASLSPEHINDQMNRYQSIEKLFFTRMVPLFIKQPVVKAFAKQEKKRVTAVLSNLGVIKMPEEMTRHITEIADFCSTNTIFITVTTYGNDFVLGITSAYQETGVIRRFVKSFEETGSSIRANVSEVIS